MSATPTVLHCLGFNLYQHYTFKPHKQINFFLVLSVLNEYWLISKVSYLLVGWLAGWLAGGLAGWLVGRQAGWLAGLKKNIVKVLFGVPKLIHFLFMGAMVKKISMTLKLVKFTMMAQPIQVPFGMISYQRIFDLVWSNSIFCQVIVTASTQPQLKLRVTK